MSTVRREESVAVRMLPDCSRLDLSALSTRVVSTAGPAGDVVLTTPELVRQILLSIKDDDDDQKEACNAAKAWCDTTADNRVMCSDNEDTGWSIVTEQVFDFYEYHAPPRLKNYLHTPPDRYTPKGWFQELCRRHGRVLGQTKRSDYYNTRLYNTSREIRQFNELLQTAALQCTDTRSMHSKITSLKAERDTQMEERDAQDRLLNRMHTFFLDEDGLYFSDTIFDGGEYKGLNEFDDKVFERQTFDV